MRQWGPNGEYVTYKPDNQCLLSWYINENEMKGLDLLADMDLEARRERTPSVPDYALTKRKFSDRTANSLTAAIVQFLNLTGNHAERVNTMGMPVYQTRVTTNCLGQKQRIGSITWLPSAGVKGSSDIHSIISGRFVAIEVKKKDRQSEAQKQYQAKVTEAGGLYWICRSFNQFLEYYKTLTDE